MVKDDKKNIYQDSITATLNREHDNNASGDVNGLEEDTAAAEAPFDEVLTAIPKVDYIFGLHMFKSELIYASAQKYYLGYLFRPPCQEVWLEEANTFSQKTPAPFSVDLGCAATMLIFNIKT
jgi:hypothetical protein